MLAIWQESVRDKTRVLANVEAERRGVAIAISARPSSRPGWRPLVRSAPRNPSSLGSAKAETRSQEGRCRHRSPPAEDRVLSDAGQNGVPRRWPRLLRAALARSGCPPPSAAPRATGLPRHARTRGLIDGIFGAATRTSPFKRQTPQRREA